MQTSFAILAIAFACTTQARNILFARDGINCEGSSNCEVSRENGGSLSAIADEMTNSINAGHAADFYNTGIQIACTSDSANSGEVCAFFQFNGAAGTLQDARNHVQDLIGHNCKVCGSVPIAPGNPDVSTGALTVNYVSSPCCHPESGKGACVCNPA